MHVARWVRCVAAALAVGFFATPFTASPAAPAAHTGGTVVAHARDHRPATRRPSSPRWVTIALSVDGSMIAPAHVGAGLAIRVRAVGAVRPAATADVPRSVPHARPFANGPPARVVA